ncbi:MAG TPA: alpha/beta hydrolase [Pyrinomonadaceae bacterium]|jgi:acetyl esterase/lipase|nr:alpha/beta hydrolase [Pyrinomonadaceae bacterium]
MVKRIWFASLALSIGALACSVTPLALLLWTVVPALHYNLWLLSVVAGEWSLYPGLVGLWGALLGIVAVRRGRRRTGFVALVCGTLAVALSLYPPLSMLRVAEANGVRLSLARYLFASHAPAVQTPGTFEFARVDGQPLLLDAYLPQASPTAGELDQLNSRRPAIVVVHGGSWKSGERSDFPQWDAWLASRGYAVFDIDYRLAPPPNWRLAVEDVQRAVVWVKEHAQQFDINPARVSLMGRSAGGQLALLAAYTAEESPKAEGPATDARLQIDARVRAVIALYAPTDLRWAYEHPANERVINGPAALRGLTGGTPQTLADVYSQASPLTHAHQNSPPTLLIHGGQDQVVRRDNMWFLLQTLQGTGAHPPKTEVGPTRYRALFIPYAQHGFDYNFNGWGAQVTQHVLLDFLNTN